MCEGYLKEHGIESGEGKREKVERLSWLLELRRLLVQTTLPSISYSKVYGAPVGIPVFFQREHGRGIASSGPCGI